MMDLSSDDTSVLLKQPGIEQNGLRQQLLEQAAEMQKLQQQVATLTQQVQQVREEKMTLLSNMNHEIRTPMNGIIGMAALLAESGLKPKQHRHTQVILESSHHLFQVLSDTMDLAELETGTLKLSPQSFLFQEMTDQVVTQLAPQAANQGLELVCALAEDLPKWVTADEPAIKRVLLALISEAIKATDHGHVFVHGGVLKRYTQGAVLHIEVLHTRAGETLASLQNALTTQAKQATGIRSLSVSLQICWHLIRLLQGDFGVKADHKSGAQGALFWCDIPIEEPQGSITYTTSAGHCAIFQNNDDRYLEHQLMSLHGTVERLNSLEALFDCYQRRNDAFNKFIIDTEGMTVKQLDTLSNLLKTFPVDSKRWVIIRNQHDSVLDEVNYPKLNDWSEITKPWSQFKLKIAVVKGSDIEAPVATEAEPFITVSRESKRREILLVEDNRVNQIVAKALLDKLGYQVTIANDGLEAIEQYLERQFDLVLMDICMPRMDGIEATQELKKMMNANDQSVPVIALTANAMLGARDKYLKLGLDDYLAKPVQAPQLKRILQKWLKPVQPHHPSSLVSSKV